MKIFILLLSIITLSPTNLYAQATNIKFEHLSEGISQNSVLCISQDSKGFMWFGTYDGLNRYDGYEFKIYKSEIKNPYSLSNNMISYIYEDHSGVLWIGTSDGLNKFDREKEIFIRYRYDTNDSNSLSSNLIRWISEDTEGTLWIGTYGGGLNKFDRERKRFTRYLFNPTDVNSISHNFVSCTYIDRSGNLWIASEGGLDRFDPAVNRFVHYRHDPNNQNSLGRNSTYRIWEDKYGIFWIGTWGGGLDRFDRRKNQFVHYRNNPNDPYSLSSDVVREIYEDRSGCLWIGTWGGGLDQFDRNSNRFIHHRANLNDPNSLSNNSVWSIYEDRSGTLWVGNDFGGINKYDRGKTKFAHYKKETYKTNSLNDNIVYSILETNDRNNRIIWIGTDGGGLNKYDRDKNLFTYYQANPNNSNSLNNNNCRALIKDRSGTIWIGTNDGLSQFDRTKGFFINYTPDFFNPNSLSSNNVFTICEDKLDYIWIGTYGGGLNRFDRREKKFKRYMVDPQNTYSLSDNFVWSIYEDHAGVLWIGTENGGLNQFDRDNNRFLRYQADPEDSNSLSSNKILCILEDRSGMLWLGTTNGLDKFNRVDKRFIHYTKDDGLPSNAIQSLLEDDHGNLWLGTLKGLSKFDPRTGKCINYKVSDGLQSNEFNVNACFKSQSGEMYFGGLNGFNIFSPDSIKNNPYIPPIVITNIQIFNKSVLIGKEIDGRIILKNSVTETKEIKLSYKENVFSFEFAALHYVSPENNQYAYMMEGFDKDWNYTDANKRYVTYTNMGGGEYVFRVKGSNSDGVWNEEGASIRIIISPPFWQTIWFYGFLALLVVCGAFWIYKRREQIRDLAEKKRIEEVIAKERNLLRTLIDNIPDAIYVKDTDSRKVIANLADVHNMGLQLEAEVLGKDDFELFPKDMAERFFADDQSVIQTGKSVVNREEYVLDEKGKKRWLLTSKIPLHDKNGHIIGLVGIGKDITNRKLIEEALHESEERFRIIAEQTGQLVYDYQLDSGVIKYAGAIQEVTGYSSNDIQDSIISDWREKIHPEDRDSVISFLEEARKTSSHYLIEYRYRRINGEYIYVEDRGVFINNELGAAQRVLGAIENITERKRTALERESLINKLQNALADVKTLSGLVPICSNCKKIRDDKGYWNQLEGFIQEHSLARFSHGICPDCMKKLYPDFMARK